MATPLLKNENYALLLASRAGFPQGPSGGKAVPVTYSKLITGGRIRPQGGGGWPATPHPPAGGVSPVFFLKKNGSLANLLIGELIR